MSLVFIMSLNAIGRVKRLSRRTFSSSAICPHLKRTSTLRPFCLDLTSVLNVKTAMKHLPMGDRIRLRDKVRVELEEKNRADPIESSTSST